VRDETGAKARLTVYHYAGEPAEHDPPTITLVIEPESEESGDISYDLTLDQARIFQQYLGVLLQRSI
jgi:hypothetical protein